MIGARVPAEPRWTRAWSIEEGERRARARWRQVFGAEGRRAWSAPGLVTLVGEYTDISGGVSLVTPIPHRTFAAAVPRDDGVVRISTDQLDESGKDSDPWVSDLGSLHDHSGNHPWAGYPADALWALLERGYAGTGMDIALVSCVPPTAGLSASTSLTAVAALAANDLWGLGLKTDIGAVDLAEACVDAENDVAGGATAGLAPHAILRGSPGEALRLDFATTPPQVTSFPLEFAEYGLGLLVIDTQTPQSDQMRTIRERMAEVDHAATALGAPSIGAMRDRGGALTVIEALEDPVLRSRARHVLTECERVELVRDDLTGTAPAHERFVAIGKAMYRSHASLDVDFGVSSDALNLAVDVAFEHGALGARLAGAGKGGSAVALVRLAQAAGTARAVDAAFRDHGLKRPEFSLV